MPVFKWSELKQSRRPYPTGTEGKPHSHPDEQIQVALKGKVRASSAEKITS